MRHGNPTVAIIGAGPYGLAVAAHLADAGVDFRMFGRPMAFWKGSMPPGMLLRSRVRSSSIADPRLKLTLPRFGAATGTALAEPLPLDTFLAYAEWFRAQLGLEIDERRVDKIECTGDGFGLSLADGENLESRSVVVAAGIGPFAAMPDVLDGISHDLASHSSSFSDATAYRGLRVLVIGGGQSAIEYAALLEEAGAEVEVVVRADGVRWLHDERMSGGVRHAADRVLYAPTDVGPPGLNWVAAVPGVVHRLSPHARSRIVARCTRPLASAWLRPRVAGIRITTGRQLVAVKEQANSVTVTLDDGSDRVVDRVLAATGYRVALDAYDFLGSELLGSIDTVVGYPRLTSGLESSVPGLHFVGATASVSFGPVMRFVTGTWYAAPAVARRVLGRSPSVLLRSWPGRRHGDGRVSRERPAE